MKPTICSALVLLVLGAPAFGQDAAPAKQVCLYTHNIKSSEPSQDEKSITFTMRNGDRWRNDLMGRCYGIRFDGYSWVLRGNDEVCDNQQTLRVLQSGGICMLGKFTQLPKPMAKVN